MYSRVPNISAALLLNFCQFSHLHGLIPTYTFIRFKENFSPAFLFPTTLSLNLHCFSHIIEYFLKISYGPGLENQTASFLSQIPSHISTSKRKFSHLLNYSHLHFYYNLKNFPTYMIIPTCTFIKICIIFSPTCLFPPTLILGTQE